MDYFRKVFERLAAAGHPDAEGREGVYAVCRAEVTQFHGADPAAQAEALEGLEKAIRRHEVQARFEDTLRRR